MLLNLHRLDSDSLRLSIGKLLISLIIMKHTGLSEGFSSFGWIHHAHQSELGQIS